MWMKLFRRSVRSPLVLKIASSHWKFFFLLLLVKVNYLFTNCFISRQSTSWVFHWEPFPDYRLGVILWYNGNDRNDDFGSAKEYSFRKFFLCVWLYNGKMMCRVAIPKKDYVFQREDIVICVLPDVQITF